MSNTFNSSINDATYLINLEKSVISSMIVNYDDSLVDNNVLILFESSSSIYRGIKILKV